MKKIEKRNKEKRIQKKIDRLRKQGKFEEASHYREQERRKEGEIMLRKKAARKLKNKYQGWHV